MKPSICLRAFAKINTGLKILGKRADGYHEIRTVYHTVELHDRLTISLSPASGIVMQCNEPSIPCDQRNLVYRACQAWKKKRKFHGGLHVKLEKRIPVGSGLGGGSSDAAATLLGLERLIGGGHLDWHDRFKLAANLGSDVPLFLLGGRVLGCGRGEEIYPLADLPRRHCLLVYPGFTISTPEAYNDASKLTIPPKNRKVDTFGVWSQFPVEEWGPAENDFEKVVFAKWPELGRIKAQFIRAGAETASLTGSGSAVYAIFVSARQIERASRMVPRGWGVFRTRTLGRGEYHRLMIESADH